MDPLVIPVVSAAAQRLEELAEAELRLLLCQFRERLDYLLVTLRPRAIAIDGTPKPDGSTGLPLAQPVLLLQLIGKLAPLSQSQSFFAITSFSARFSNDRSAYICLRRRFSSSSSRSRLMSEASMPPYFDFHW